MARLNGAIGEGDLSQELGVPRLGICQEQGVACSHPHVDSAHVAHVIDQGLRWLMPAPVRSFSALEEGRRLVGR